jgi:23S rRNA (guanosine2251-2'-O)-methyltransferase
MNSIIAGRKPVMEALRAGTRIEQIVFLAGVQGPVVNEITSLAERLKIRVSRADKQQFRELATDATAQGVVAIVRSKAFVGLEELLAIGPTRGERGFLLILDEIEDPHNLGALVRTAECAGVHGVIVPKHHAAPVTPTVVKTSAGATEHMAMAEVTNIVNTIETLKERGYWIVGLASQGTASYAAVDYTVPVALVVGNEGKGIRRLVREHCDHLVKIPLSGRIGSLNASVAGGLAMFEVVRQRQQAAAPQA